MDAIYAIARFLVNEILSVPAFLIGIITAVGLVALRKSVGAVIGGGLKATLGFLLVGAGATLVTASLDPLGVMIQGALGAQGVVPTNEAIAGIAQQEYGAQVSWLMILGFVVALVLARFSPLHYVFLTGHHILFMATMSMPVSSCASGSVPHHCPNSRAGKGRELAADKGDDDVATSAGGSSSRRPGGLTDEEIARRRYEKRARERKRAAERRKAQKKKRRN